VALQYGHQDLLKTAIYRLDCTFHHRVCEGSKRTDGVVIDDALSFGLCGTHGGRTDTRTEEAA
jgi:hypothetical protein